MKNSDSSTPTVARAIASCLLYGALATGTALPMPAFADTPPASTSQREAWDLGVVLEFRRPNREGLEVLAVTPGGAGAGLGLKPKDRLKSINGYPLTGIDAVDNYAQGIVQSQGQVRLEIIRGGSLVLLDGPLQKTASNPSRGCGYVTALGPTPRISQNIYGVEITMIDGDSTPLTPQNRYQLEAGRHVLVVAERIDSHRLNNAQNLQRTIMKRQERARAYKALVVEVAPDTTHNIGARLLTEKLDNASIRANEYWEPVAWKTVDTRCR